MTEFNLFTQIEDAKWLIFRNFVTGNQDNDMEIKTIGITTNNETDSAFNGRLRFISYLQVIGIILVVLGHSIHECPGVKEGEMPVVLKMMYSFRMPLFLFVSGFLMIFTTYYRNRVRSVKDFVKGKVLRLLLPFVVLSILTFVPRSFTSAIADDAIELSVNSFLRSFIYSDSLVIPYYWFLQASFILLALNYVALALGKKFGVNYKNITLLMWGVFLCISIAPFSVSPDIWNFFSLGRVLTYGVYFTAGMVYCSYFRKVDSLICWTSKIFFVVSILVWAGIYFISDSLFCSFAGIIMCISFAKILATREKCFLDHLVGANYLIFLLSWYCNVLSQQVLHHYVALPWWVYSLLSLISGIYIPWLIYRYMLAHRQNRSVKVVAFLLGQNINKTKAINPESCESRR